ncbi:hypothetical protein GCM10009741_02730 [Kribbella lupini]|uniref:Uncharacterized protein n=1 Tax=Kribbella lupini TaxID=291602 RepID=A0ABP4KS42_9ACTN
MAAGGDGEQGEGDHVDSVYTKAIDGVYSPVDQAAITLRVSPIETPGSTAGRSCA